MAVTTDQSDIDACLYLIDTLKKSLGMEVSARTSWSPAARTEIIDGLGTSTITITLLHYPRLLEMPDDDVYNNYILDLVSVSLPARSSMSEARWAEQPEVMQESCPRHDPGAVGGVGPD